VDVWVVVVLVVVFGVEAIVVFDVSAGVVCAPSGAEITKAVSDAMRSFICLFLLFAADCSLAAGCKMLSRA
jgi:hypothetical protein